MNAPRLKIAVLTRVFDEAAGGAERYSVTLVRQLADRHDVHVFAQRFASLKLGDTETPTWTAHSIAGLAHPRWLNQLWYAMATWWCTRRGFDVVHSHELTWHGHVQTVQVQAVRHSLWQRHLPTKRWQKLLQIVTSPRLATYWLLERQRMRALDCRVFVATSPQVVAQVAQCYPHTQGVLHCITPGIDLPSKTLDAAQRQQLREAAKAQLGLDPQAQYLLFISNDYTKKGLTTLLRALTQLRQKVRLLVVGDARQQSHYAAMAQQLGVLGRIHFWGQMSDPTVAYQAADLMVHPTLEDTFAMVALEALAHGLPLVVSREPYCGFAHYVQDGVHASVLQNPQDATELANRCERLLSNKPIADAMVTHGYAVVAGFSWTQVAAQYERLYQDIHRKATAQ